MISAHARRMSSAKTSRVSSAETAHVASAETTDVTSAEATHGTSAETTTAAVSAAATATATCLCTRRKQRPGKQGGCQYHHRSSSSHNVSFQRPEPVVIIEPVALAQIWPPGSE